MNEVVWDPLVLFWTLVVFSSVGWYALLLFLVGIKGGMEIVQMTKNLSAKPEGGQTH